MIRVGQKVLIDPFKDIRSYGVSMVVGKQEGVVVYVNYPHKWFSVEYGNEDNRQLTSYKFFDIKEAVKFIN